MDAAGTSLLLLEVDQRRCALPTGAVVELQRAVAQEPLPAAPAVVEGLIDLRGETVPVLDLRLRLGLAPRAPHPDHVLVVVDLDGRTVALRADAALDVVEVPEEVIEDARDAVPGARFVAGLLHSPDGIVVIHDLAQFLSWEEATALDAALARGAPAGQR
ncbi:MAG TPA: chemotaxis protein CheW [Nitriliruptorales bacterium]|nr:chemotaxis protein CheW [Nitriliruptorales bacterium]